MMRYLRVLRVFLANSLQLELEYRTSLAINMLNSLLGLGAGIMVLFALFGQGTAIGGWSFSEALTLFGVFIAAEAFIEIVVHPSLSRVPDHIREGGMDYMLLKPMNLQFLISLRYWNVWSLPNLMLGLGIVLYGMTANDAFEAANLGLFLLMTLSGCVVIYALWAMISVTAFWFVRIGNAHMILVALMGAGRFPVTAYPAWLRLLLTFILPVAFVTTVPASAAIGRLDWPTGVASLTMACAALALSAVCWRVAAKSYTSASS